MAKGINLKHYLIFILINILYFTGMVWLIINIQKLPIVTNNYFSETDKIKSGLNYLIDYKCNYEAGDLNEKWICDKKDFVVEDIEADRDRAYATGTGKTINGVEFYWVAVKNESWWNAMGFGKNGDKIKCEDIPVEIDAKKFDGKYRYCYGKEGKSIDRLSGAN